ncbi:unnamed protein product [Rotaria sp. Silwood1]|nr:unnamed protein product [Rotaria sp. Silwood1]
MGRKSTRNFGPARNSGLPFNSIYITIDDLQQAANFKNEFNNFLQRITVIFEKEKTLYSYEKLQENDISFFNKIQNLKKLIHLDICDSINSKSIFDAIKALMNETNEYMSLTNNKPPECREKPFDLIIALNSNGNTEGDLVYDDEESIDIIGSKSYYYATYKWSSPENRLLINIIEIIIQKYLI